MISTPINIEQDVRSKFKSSVTYGVCLFCVLRLLPADLVAISQVTSKRTLILLTFIVSRLIGH